jgi:cobyric acid synthase
MPEKKGLGFGNTELGIEKWQMIANGPWVAEPNSELCVWKQNFEENDMLIKPYVWGNKVLLKPEMGVNVMVKREVYVKMWH